MHCWRCKSNKFISTGVPILTSLKLRDQRWVIREQVQRHGNRIAGRIIARCNKKTKEVLKAKLIQAIFALHHLG